MPKIEIKQIQTELQQGRVRPVYWIYGTESLKVRELVKRIRQAVFGQVDCGQVSGNASWGSMQETRLEGAEVSVSEVLDRALSIPLGGGVSWIQVRDAHLLKDAEDLSSLLEDAGPRKLEELTSVCLFIAKDLDARKKISKLLLEKVAVIPCDEVPENQREAWIEYLASRRGIKRESIDPVQWGKVLTLMKSLDPWSLEGIDQEWEKWELAGGVEGNGQEVLLGGQASQSELLCDALLDRKAGMSLLAIRSVSQAPDEALPLIGLIAWNLRQLVQYLSDQKSGRAGKVNPYLGERLRRWEKKWTIPDLLEFQSRLFDLDFNLKQTAQSPLGLWTDLVRVESHSSFDHSSSDP